MRRLVPLVVAAGALSSLALVGAGCDKGEDKPAGPPATVSETAPPPASAPSAPKPKEPAGDGGAVVTDPKTLKRIDDLRAVQGSMPVPDAIANTPTAAEFTRFAASLFKDHGAEKFAIVQIMGIDGRDQMTRAKVLETTRRYQLVSSGPAIQMDGATKMNLFTAVAPVKDLEQLAKWLTDANLGTDVKVDQAKRTITLTAVKPTAP
jgi:hypothetical protein